MARRGNLVGVGSMAVLALLACSCGTEKVAQKPVNLPVLARAQSSAVRALSRAGYGDASETWSRLGVITKPVVLRWECEGPGGIRFETAGKTLAYSPECGNRAGVVFSASIPTDLVGGQKLVWTASKRTEWRVLIYEK